MKVFIVLVAFFLCLGLSFDASARPEGLGKYDIELDCTGYDKLALRVSDLEAEVQYLGLSTRERIKHNMKADALWQRTVDLGRLLTMEEVAEGEDRKHLSLPMRAWFSVRTSWYVTKCVHGH